MSKGVERMTARELIEDIANWPITKGPTRDRFGEIESGSQSYGEGYTAWRNQELARAWLRLNPTAQPGAEK